MLLPAHIAPARLSIWELACCLLLTCLLFSLSSSLHPSLPLQPGNWTLSQVAPFGTALERWDCYSLNTTTGNWSTTPIPNITDSVLLVRGISTACVAQYIVLPLVPRLALLSWFPEGVNSTTPRLQALNTVTNNSACDENPSTRWAPPNVTVTSPGDGWCGAGTPSGVILAGNYSINATLSPTVGTSFARWDCYNISTGSAVPINITVTGAGIAALSLPLGSAVTCVAVYDVFPRLALLSQYPAAYTATTTSTLSANLGPDPVCPKSPSGRIGVNNATIVAPGPAGLCGTTGSVPPANYSLGQTFPPAGTTFIRWECNSVSNGNSTLINMTATPNNIDLRLNAVVTCVAVYQLLPQLSLLSQVAAPSGMPYSGPGGNLTAVGPSSSSCNKATSDLVSATVNVTSPGAAAQCGAAGTAVGQYNLTQIEPTGTAFVRWECYSVSGSSSTAITLITPSAVQLQLDAVVTCLAVYNQLPKLNLLSQVSAPAGFPYTGVGGSLTATGPSSSCNKATSDLINATITITSPGAGAQCGAAARAVGQYSLTQVAPAGTTFVRWDCYNITGGTEGVPVSGTSVTLAVNEVWSCVASECRW
jgi:hypothetical protein